MIEDFGYILSGPKRGQPQSGADLIAALAGPELAWADLQFSPDTPQDARNWIARIAPHLDTDTVDALTGEGSRPRALAAGRGVLLMLRDVPSVMPEDADDMPSIRLYIDAQMVVSLSRRPARSLSGMRDRCAHAAMSAQTTGDFLHDLVTAIADNVLELIELMMDRTDLLEDAVDAPGPSGDPARREATRLRRSVLAIRRYMAPQRDALDTFRKLEIVPKSDRRRLTEIHDRSVHQVEELDQLTSRLMLVREAIAAAQAERLNRQLYLVAVLSALFLPLTFLTGLLGVNLAGIPGARDGNAFWIFCIILAIVVAMLALILRRLRWL